MKHKPITFETAELSALLELVRLNREQQMFADIENKLFVAYCTPKLYCRYCAHAEPEEGILHNINITCPHLAYSQGRHCKACRFFEPCTDMELNEEERNIINLYKIDD